MKVCKAFHIDSKSNNPFYDVHGKCGEFMMEAVAHFSARHALGSDLLYEQVSEVGNPIEPIPPSDFFTGDFTINRVDFENIQKVPIFFWYFENDTDCPIDINDRIYDQVYTEKFGYVQPNADHLYPMWIQGDIFMAKLVSAIEQGDFSYDYEDEGDYKKVYT